MTAHLRRWFRLWFLFDERVTRRAYVASGVSLAIVKYLTDALIVWLASGRLWHPLDYLSPSASLWTTRLQQAPAESLTLLAAWSLPFLWIGVSMSMRRALDAGASAWLALLFFVPGVNYLFMAAMSVLPSRAPSATAPAPRPHERQLPSALLAIAAGLGLGAAMLGLSVVALQDYGPALFLGTPFVVGAVTAWLFNRRYPASERETQQVVLMTMACIGGLALLSAAEGAICLLMAAPLAVGIGAMGAALGRRIALHDRGPVANALLAVVLLPMSAVVDARQPVAVGLREVRSAIEIDAAPDVVWRSVIAFPPLPEPSELLFRTGIAYPMRAELVGTGVGAVRHCVFSTGAFVEPITAWEPGRRLAFDVARQPRPMQEWSPYADLAPPHLDGWMRSRRGEFRLIPLPGGRTRLEGSTWYEMRLEPAAYWVLFGDGIIHRIHGRVLRHIRANAEIGSAGRGKG